MGEAAEHVDETQRLPVSPSAPAVPSDAAGWREVIAHRRQSVVLVECCAGVGSGLLVSLDGLVVTNRHVVSQAEVFMLRFHDGSKAKAVLVHAHGSRDLAVLRAAIRRDQCFDVERDVAGCGPETVVHAGDDVLAIGHPRGLAFTATRGIVSEPHRRLPDGEYVQTDVAINPGNSGGPLLDRAGRLVGLNTRIHEDSEGLGFAIPGPEVRAYVLYVTDQLRRRSLRFPTDAEIAAATQRMSPADVATAAVRATGLRHRAWGPATVGANGPEQRLRVHTLGGCPFDVAIVANQFHVSGTVAGGLTDKQQRDGKFLLQLLRWQNDLCGPCFTIADNNLSVSLRRGVDGLDVSEAREAILRVAEALDAVYRPVLRQLGR